MRKLYYTLIIYMIDFKMIIIETDHTSQSVQQELIN